MDETLSNLVLLDQTNFYRAVTSNGSGKNICDMLFTTKDVDTADSTVEVIIFILQQLDFSFKANLKGN